MNASSPTLSRRNGRMRRSVLATAALALATASVGVLPAAPVQAATLSRNLPRMVVSPPVVSARAGGQVEFTVQFVRRVTGGVSFQILGAPRGSVLSAFPGTGYDRRLVLNLPVNAAGTYPLTLWTRNPGPDRSAKLRLDVVGAPVATLPPVTAPPVTAPPVTAPPITAPPAPPVTAVAPQFALSFEGSSRQLVRLGQAVTFGVIASRSNFAGNISFTLLGLPGGAAAAFDPNPSAGNTRLLVKTPAGVPTGDYNLLITGQAGTTTRTIVAVLQVRAAETVSVTAVAPNPVEAGKSVSSSVTVSIQNGDGNGAVLATEGLPVGVTSSFRNNPTTGKTTMDIFVPASVLPGAYPFNVVARKGEAVGRAQTTLLVNLPTPTLRYQVTPVTAVPGQGIGFVLIPTSAGLSQARGSTVAFDINVTPTGGFNGAIDLALTGLLPGSSATLSNGPSANIIRLTLSAPVQLTGSTTLVLTGTSGSLKSVIAIPLTVS